MKRMYNAVLFQQCQPANLTSITRMTMLLRRALLASVIAIIARFVRHAKNA